ncbi:MULTISPECIES: hypothetical protein [unclassified Aeromicrobium]|uniref:hypothetical protein n=1 Tax=unclassified Aeromicrobium TaxID=2633570 RepID=UPI00396B43B6
MKRKAWTPAQTLVRDQILAALKEHGEMPVGDVGRLVTVYGRHCSGRITNDLLVLVTAGLVQVRRGESIQVNPWAAPKPGLKLWSLTEAAEALFVSADDLPPLEVIPTE